jgi:hypothetical protein
LAAVALFVLSPVLLCAQASGSPVSITGCLKQGSEKGGYYVVAEDGKMYELIGHAAQLSKHVNHTVTVTGQEVKLPESQESKLEPHEKTEAGNETYIDLQPTDVKMVSATCK